MRRRFGQFLDKHVELPRSTSPSGSKSPKTQGVEGQSSISSVLNHCGLKDTNQTMQHEGLKLSISHLIGFLDGLNMSLDATVLSKLHNELKELSGIIPLLPKDPIGALSQKLSENLTRDIDAAVKNARSLLSNPSTRFSFTKPDSTQAISGLSNGLHTAIENYRVQTAAPSNLSPPTTQRTTREISGRVAGALSIAEKMLDGVPVPGLKAAVGGLLEVLGAINKLIDNDDDLIKLIDHLQRLVEIVKQPTQENKNELDQSLEKRVKDLTEDIRNITAHAATVKEQNLGSKFLGRADNASAIAGLSVAVDRAVDRFQVSGTMGMELGIGKIRGGVEQLGERLEAGTKGMEQELRNIKDDIGLLGKGVGRILEYKGTAPMSESEEAALNVIHPRVDSARYDSSSQTSSSFCLKETRVSLLQEIEEWAEDTNSRPIFWLCGMAGTGKTTIARTVARQFDESNRLGASFFFSRDEDDRRTTNLLFPTIAYQLALRNPSLREHVVGAATQHVCTAMLRTQLNKLIVEPLQRANPQSSPLVIVMDALDECIKESQITEMLVLLAPAIRSIQNTVNLKVFLTSRPEIHISTEFKEPGMEAVSSVSILHDIEKSLVQSDISRYIEYHLHRIAKVILLSHTVWPTSGELEALADMADGLFIFAAVTIAYIGDTKHRRPKQRLQNILTASEQKQSSVSFRHLDVLYRQILMASLADGDGDEDEDEDHRDIMLQSCEILGTIVLLMYPLSSRSLERLLGWDEETVGPTLGPFHSVLSIPHEPTPIRVFHKSFPDFLTDKQRSGGFWFHIESAEHHGRLALLCLTHMNATLRRDMCGVGNKLVSEIDDVESILQTKVGEHVLYACRHWATHLNEATRSEKLEAALKHFCEYQLLYWLEILCLYGKLSSGILALDSAIKWTRDNTSSEILANGYRYLLYFQNTISLGPCHIYLSTLPFVPRLNLSNSPWEREVHASPRVIRTDGNDKWDRVLFTLTSHSGDVNTVAYSPDGGTIATGGDDSRVIIWDSRTGSQIHILEGHSRRVWAVDFSPNDSLVASGSEDKSVRIWGSATGILIHTLERHSQGVRAVCFSPLGHMIASGSYDMTIILWDSGTGSFIRMLSGHSSIVLSITFSPDGAQIVSSSSDPSIIIWDTETGTVISRLQGSESGSTVYSLAFSPDGTQLASTCNGDVILWNYESHIILRKLEGSTGGVCCVAFSPDGRFVLVGCEGGQVVTWDTPTGCQIGTFSGHTGWVASVAVSPDGSRVVTGSYDDTVTVWDMSSSWESDGIDSPNQKSHTGAVTHVAFSPDGTMLASVAMDKTVALWDIGRHSLIHILRGHKSTVTTVVISPDNTMLAAITASNKVALWNIGLHSPIQILKGHRDTVTTVAFSADGRTLASGSMDKSIIVWDTESGESIKTLQLRREVRCLGFSLDGRYLVAACDRSRSKSGPAKLKMWTIEDSQPCQSSSPTVEVSKEVLSGSPASGSPPSGIYLARDENSQWVEKRCQGNAVERLCHLPQHDIIASASLGRTFAFGTSRGTVCILDFPPKTFGITATTMYPSHDMFDFDFDSNVDDPYPDSD